MSAKVQTQVKAQSTSTTTFASAQTNLLQNKGTGKTERDEVPPIVHEMLRSPGQPLDSATRAWYEKK
jgi:hypothetical protein